MHTSASTPPQPLMRCLHVAVLLGCTSAWVRTLTRKGVLPGAVMIGKRLMFRRDAIEAMIAAGGTAALPVQNPTVIARHAARGHSQAGARTRRKKPVDLVKDRSVAAAHPFGPGPAAMPDRARFWRMFAPGSDSIN